MATASVSNIPECSICFESLKIPKVLTCGHTFCLCCIERYIGDKSVKFPCPICQQDVPIPEGGAKMFTTNFILQTSKHTTQVRDQTPSTTQHKCPNHNQKEVDYYCNNCNVGLCLKCIFKQHKEHETLDVECEETRNKAIGKLQRLQKNIQNRIKHLENTRSMLLQSFEQMKSVCEDSCAKVTKKTEQIVSELRKSCEQIIKDIRKNLEDNRNKVEDREMEITSEINVLESNMDSIISPSTETTLNILQTLPRLAEIEKLDENMKDHNLCLQYLQWVEREEEKEEENEEQDGFSLYDIGSVIFKSFYIPGWYQFLFNVSDIEKDDTDYYSMNKFRYNNLVWSSCVGRIDGDLYIAIELLEDDNPKLDYCIFDGQFSLLNIDNDDESKTKTYKEMRLEIGGLWEWNPITWTELTDKNNGYLNSSGQFLVQFDIKQVREIS